MIISHGTVCARLILKLSKDTLTFCKYPWYIKPNMDISERIRKVYITIKRNLFKNAIIDFWGKSPLFIFLLQ